MSAHAFGELRSLLQHAPSLRAWYRICELVEHWPPGAFEEEVLPYMQNYIEREPWSAQSRMAPTRWMLSLMEGEPMPYLLLASDIMIRQHHIPPNGMEMLTRCGHLVSIEHIRLNNITTDEPLHKLLKTLGSLTTVPSLYGLHLQHLPLTPTAIDALVSGTLIEQVQMLSLRNAALNREVIQTLLQGRAYPNLRELDVREHTMGDHNTAYLIEHVLSPMPRLLRLGVSCAQNTQSAQQHQNSRSPSFRLF